MRTGCDVAMNETYKEAERDITKRIHAVETDIDKELDETTR